MEYRSHPLRRTLAATILIAAGLVPVNVSAAGHPESLVSAADRPETEVVRDLSAQLPFTDEVRRGSLNNGLDFYVRSHSRPENTVVLRLVVDAGSVLERESERGLAHFVEHMAFNGTEEFPEGELVAYLETLGMRFGPDINAYTSFDETVYKLEIPTDDPEALRRGFRVMQQWASAVTFEPEWIESERGVIVEEWRRGRGAQARMMDRHIPVLLQDSRYAERLPIGDMDIVRSATRDDLVGFYRRWYRPDNIALIAVGDLPADQLEGLVREHMGEIPAAAGPLNRPYFDLPDQAGTRVSIASDREATRSTVAIYLPEPPDAFYRVGDYRNILVRSLFASVINERLREVTRDPQAPISSASIGWSRLLRNTEIAVAGATARDERVPEALELLVTEIERAERFGILPGELDRARARFMQSVEDSLVNARTRPAGSIADELVRHWTRGEPVPGIEFEYLLYETLLPTVTLEEVNEVAGRFSRSDNRIILAGLREGDPGFLPDGDPLPDEEDLLAILYRTEERMVSPPVPEEDHSLLVPDEPDQGTIIRRTTHAAVQTTEYHLSNGMRLFVRPSDLRDDEILFSAFSPGGLSLIPDELVPAARIAADVAEKSGLGDLDATALERALAGRSAQLSVSIGEHSERMSGRSRKTDLDQLFQLVHLGFTTPRFEERALATVVQQRIQHIRGTGSSPQGIFSRRFQELYAGGDVRLTPLEEEMIIAVTLEQVEEVYRDRFADPADFALFFAGNVTLEEIEELAVRYLAGIPRPTETMHPATEAPAGFLERVADTGRQLPRELFTETIRAGSEPVAQVGIVFHNDYRWSREENHRFNSLSDLLSIRLRESIREEAGGTYGVGAAGWRYREPEPAAYMQIFFGMDPDRSEELIEAALTVVEEVRREPADESYLERIRAQQREQYRRSLRENSYWLSVLQFAVQHGRELEEIPEFPELIESLTAEDIRNTAERYLEPGRRFQLLLLPAEE